MSASPKHVEYEILNSPSLAEVKMNTGSKKGKKMSASHLNEQYLQEKVTTLPFKLSDTQNAQEKDLTNSRSSRRSERQHGGYRPEKRA